MKKKDKFCIVNEHIWSSGLVIGLKWTCDQKVAYVLSRLNEISGDCEKIVFQCYIPKLPGKQQQFGGLFDTPKLSPIDESHEQSDSLEVSSWET